jgi:phosphohistidine phosphatase
VKTLHLLRHTKSDWSDPGLADHDRPLNERGKRARKVIARHVRGWPVDLVVCSTAVRARATAKPVIEALHAPVVYESAIYEAHVSELLDVVQALPDDAATVLMVGHNPGFEDLTFVLCGTTPPYPTGGLGTIELAVDRWSAAGPGTGTVVAHVNPAELETP